VTRGTFVGLFVGIRYLRSWVARSRDERDDVFYGSS